MPRKRSPIHKERLKKSKEYEEAFQAVTHFNRTTLGYDRVEPGKDYDGVLSGVKRQIDATIFLPNGESIYVECRQYKMKIDIKHVEGFDAKVRFDLCHDKAMMVTCIGYSKAALKYAKARNIALIMLNSAATPLEYHLRMNNQEVAGFLDTITISDHATFHSTMTSVDEVKVSDEVSYIQATNQN